MWVAIGLPNNRTYSSVSKVCPSIVVITGADPPKIRDELEGFNICGRLSISEALHASILKNKEEIGKVVFLR
jgi:hypothetical protein